MKNQFKVTHFCNFLNIDVQILSIQKENNLCYCVNSKNETFDILLKDLKPVNY